jgi:hypothetical protein
MIEVAIERPLGNRAKTLDHNRLLGALRSQPDIA